MQKDQIELILKIIVTALESVLDTTIKVGLLWTKKLVPSTIRCYHQTILALNTFFIFYVIFYSSSGLKNKSNTTAVLPLWSHHGCPGNNCFGADKGQQISGNMLFV